MITNILNDSGIEMPVRKFQPTFVWTSKLSFVKFYTHAIVIASEF